MEEKYSSIGKEYNGEKAIISLTSWKARIYTVGKTLFSLLKMCPGFHIVLVLSEEEFPQKEKELPENLMIFVKKEFIEILWIYPNWKSFKKILPTMDKYRNVPVISADDDCIYACNYAEELYKYYLNDKKCIFYCSPGQGSGWGYIWPPYVYNKYTLSFIKLYELSNNDDLLYIKLAKYLKIDSKCIKLKSILMCHDTNEPINMGYIYRTQPEFRRKENQLFDKVISEIL